MSRSLPFTRSTLSLLAACALTACGDEPFELDVTDGIPEFNGALTALATPCAFVSGTGIATVTLASGEIALISRRAVDSAILANGVACGTATATLLKRLNITGAAGDETVILDFQNGLFGAGTTASAGIVVDLLGGTGDALKFRGQKTADTVTFGVDGINTAADTARDVTAANVETFVAATGDAADIVTGAGGAGTGAAFTSAVTVFGGAGNDTITGGTGADTLSGGDGADIMNGGLGDDSLDGGAGNDTFNEGAVDSGSDTFVGGADTDTVSYALRTAAVTASIETSGVGTDNDGESGEGDDIDDDIEVLTGGTVDDTLTGGAGNETINGGAGNDTIDGGDGDDILNGDAGDDSFDEGSADNGGDIINGGAGTDTVDYSARTAALTVTMDGAAADDGLSGELDNVKADVENLLGGTAADTITGNALANTITGGAGDDVMNGGAGDDTFAEEAADSGSDVFNGGAGTDTVDYSLRVAALTVTMDGVAADDGLSGEADDVKSDVENCFGGDEADTITGNASDNRLIGGLADDILNGGAGNDTLEGGAGADTLNGDAGDDVLDGEAGVDVVDGGAGDGDICFDGTANCEL